MEQLASEISGMLQDGAYGSPMPADFGPTRSLLASGVIDSFGLFRFVRDLEKRFKIKVRDKDIHPANFENIENVARFVSAKRAALPQA